MVDGCGALGPMDEELCGRWMQMAAFMPMVRVYHNATYLDDNNMQKTTPPFNWWAFQSFDATFMVTSAIAQRMPYLRHIYSNLFIKTGQKVTWPIIKPLFLD